MAQQTSALNEKSPRKHTGDLLRTIGRGGIPTRNDWTLKIFATPFFSETVRPREKIAKESTGHWREGVVVVADQFVEFRSGVETNRNVWNFASFLFMFRLCQLIGTKERLPSEMSTVFPNNFF